MFSAPEIGRREASLIVDDDSTAVIEESPEEICVVQFHPDATVTGPLGAENAIRPPVVVV
jgi:carbamoylphosphate synthase small subunit